MRKSENICRQRWKISLNLNKKKKNVSRKGKKIKTRKLKCSDESYWKNVKIRRALNSSGKKRRESKKGNQDWNVSKHEKRGMKVWKAKWKYRKKDEGNSKCKHDSGKVKWKYWKLLWLLWKRKIWNYEDDGKM